MIATTHRRPGRPPRLSRAAVLAAAVELADERGLDALSMRAVAARVGAEAMSLYRHVENKEDLLDGIVDLVYAEIDLPDPGVGWKRAMRDRAISTRHALLRHPWATALMESRLRPGPANMRLHDAVTGLLLDVGMSSLLATRAYNLVDSYVYGFVIQEVSLPVATGEALAEVGPDFIARIPAEFPNLARVGAELVAAGFDYGSEFEIELDLVLDAIEAMVAGA